MANPPEITRAILTHRDLVTRVRQRVESFARRYWASMESHRDADIARMVNAIVPVALGAQRQMVTLTDVYLASLATAAGYQQRPMGAPAAQLTGEPLRSVPPTEVYRRAGTTVWTALSLGTSYRDAAQQGLARLLDIVSTDLQLSRTHTARWRQQRDDTVVGYRRILTGSEDCALCVLASTQRYRRGDLMPIHPGCDCDEAEIRGSVDPGQVLDPDAVDRLHANVQEQFGTSDRSGRSPLDYRDIAVRQHGEYGPTLTWRSQGFTGPSDLPLN